MTNQKEVIKLEECIVQTKYLKKTQMMFLEVIMLIFIISVLIET